MNGRADSPQPRRDLTWDELPPKRRRFWGWLFVLVFLIAPLARIPFEFAGLSSFAAAMVVLAVIALILVPLGRDAWHELKQRRAGGEDIPPTIGPRIVVGWSVAAVVSWGLFAWLVSLHGPLLPAVPMFITVFAVLRFSQWRRQKT
jgi:hypothetical protein